MTQETFFNTVLEEIKNMVKGEVHLQEVTKQGDLILHGISIVGESNLSPVIYLENYYDSFEAGKLTIIEIAQDVINLWKKHNTDLSNWQEHFNEGNFFVKVLNKNLSASYIKDSPKKEIAGTNFVYIPFVKFDFGEETNASSKITYKLLDYLGISETELFEKALNNCKEKLKPVARNIIDILKEEFNIDEDMESNNKYDMTVVSNEKKIHGAAVIFYSDILKKIASEKASDLIIIPSSTHEVIVIPYCKNMNDKDLEHIKNMISDTNRNFVDVDEVLDDIPYLYKRETDSIEMML